MDNQEKIAKAIGEYNVGKLIRFEHIPRGYANDNFKIITTKGKYLLRFPNQQTIENQEKECQLMQVLKKYDFPTAYPIPDRNGHCVSHTDEITCILYDFIEGNELKINPASVDQIALALSHLHKIPIESVPFKTNYINPHSVENLITGFSLARNPRPEIFDHFQDNYFRLKPFLHEFLPSGLIHSDIFPDNTLFVGNQLKAIIDFEEFCIDHFLFDIGMTINGFCFRDNQLDNNLLQLFIRTYAAKRKLIKEEMELLPVYIQWAALGMAFWHLKNHLIDAKNPRQERRVLELLERVEHINQNPIYQ